MSQQLKDRTKAFAVRIIKMCREISGGKIEDILIKQIVRSATSTGANYRSALRGNVIKLSVISNGVRDLINFVLHEFYEMSRAST
jgi:hypothetical protein